jgi:glutamate carboxypeptidase
MKKLLAIFLISILSPTSLYAAQLSTIEKQIQNYITEQEDPALALLEHLVNINSGTMNFAGIQKVGETLQQPLAELGFTTHWVKMPQRGGTLVAEHAAAASSKQLLLIGHLDTVFPSDSPFQHFQRHGSIATGPGVIDDKGGVVVILYALKALQAAGVLENMAITVVLTGDEEDSSKPISISRRPLIQAAQQSDIALDFEWSLGLDTATIARRGIAHWTVKTTGNEAHSSKIFELSTGDGAIFEMARILNTMREQLSQEEDLTFSPGIILGGNSWHYEKSDSTGAAFGKDNIVAKAAFAKGDIRFLTEGQLQTVADKMRAIVAQNLSGTTASISFEKGAPAMLATEHNKQLLQKYSRVSVDLGYGAVKALDPGLRGAADISYVAGSLSANLAGLGPAGTGAHSSKETLAIPSLSIATQRAALLMYRLTHTVEN